jgi:hypothetical protein
MGWVKLDDNFPRHPKVVALSLEAKWAYIEGLCYSACYRTDGVVPDPVAANGPVREELLAAGLWESGTAAVVIHDWFAYNPPRAYYEDKSVAGAKGAASRWSDSTSHRSRDGTSNSRTRPVPEPDPKNLQAFDEFWEIYPRHVGKPKARSAFKQALKRAGAEDILLGAKRYAEDPNRTDEYTAHPTTWLHRDGWEDEALPDRKDKPKPMVGSEEWAKGLVERGR